MEGVGVWEINWMRLAGGARVCWRRIITDGKKFGLQKGIRDAPLSTDAEEAGE